MHDDPFDRGFAADLDALRAQRGRRAVLGLVGGGAAVAGGAVLLGGGGASAVARAALGACAAEIPAETGGPFPADGTNGPNVLDDEGVVRRDIRGSFAGATGRARGVPLRLVLTLQDTATCAPVSGLAVYAWHCDQLGRYSVYSDGATEANFLRGVQVSNDRGRLRFRTIFPGCYPGRWPHVHFEVYSSLADATGGSDPVVTSQLAFPRRQSMRVYRNDDRYVGSEANLNRISIGTDGVFGEDDGERQLATMSGNLSDGLTARLVVPVDV
ncbi:3,4-dioxygenase subunit beta [Nocardioides humilatus]|nr:3,4-dioxygenase subunit beta [Nocardioides humilatus]